MTVSVIIPVYNGEKYIRESIQSALQQDRSSLSEVIVVDDGSTDRTREIVLDLFPDVTYHYQCNKGVGAAKNSGGLIATSKYLAFLDADDLWHKDKLRVQVDAIEKTGKDMAFTHVQHFKCPTSSKNTSQSLDPMPGKFSTTLLIRKDALGKTGGFTEAKNIGEFIDWYSRAKSAGLTELMVPEVLAYRRIHDHNMTVNLKGSFNDYASVLKAHLERRRGEKK